MSYFVIPAGSVIALFGLSANLREIPEDVSVR